MSPAALFLSVGLLFASWLDLVAPFVNDAARWSREGETNYHQEDWAAAAEQYDRAAEAEPGGVREYNRGAAAYKNGKFEEALVAFTRAAGSGDVDPGRVAFDRGNASMRNGDVAGALEQYREALRIHPEDEDARANFELAYRLLQEAPKQPQSGGQEEQDSDSRESGDSEQSQQNPGAPQDQKGGREEHEDESRSSASNPAQADSSSGQPEPQDTAADGEPLEPAKMTPAEAQRLLNAVTPEERELLEARLKAARRKRAEKDW